MKKILLILTKILTGILLVAATVFIASNITPIYNFEEPEPFNGPDIFDPYEDMDWDLGWKRANFHTHTRVKGIFNECPHWPDTVYRDYARLGYDILTFSNHNEITEHPTDSALQVDVYEHGYNIFQFHKLVFGPKNGVNLFDHLTPFMPSQRQWQLDMLSHNADFLILNHPDRTRLTTKRDMEVLTGYRIMEGDSGVSTEFIHWDEALSAGHYSFGITNDDCHNSRASGRIAVRCSFLNSPSAGYEDIKNTLLSGKFYSMRVPDYGNGDWDAKYAGNADLPHVRHIGASGDTISLRLSRPAASIVAIGQGHTALSKVEDADSLGYVMTPSDSYVRMTAYFDDGAVIYTNAFARYDKSEAESPYRESPHPVNIPFTILFNLLVVLLTAGCILMFIRLFPHKEKES